MEWYQVQGGQWKEEWKKRVSGVVFCVGKRSEMGPIKLGLDISTQKPHSLLSKKLREKRGGMGTHKIHVRVNRFWSRHLIGSYFPEKDTLRLFKIDYSFHMVHHSVLRWTQRNG